MKVSEVLSSKGRKIEMTLADTRLDAAARQLQESEVGSLLVRDNAGELVGILTERDLVVAMAKHADVACSLPVREVMSSARKCAPDDDLARVAARMTSERVRHFVVCQGDLLEGVISIGDVVKQRFDQCELEVGVLRDYARTGLAALSR